LRGEEAQALHGLSWREGNPFRHESFWLIVFATIYAYPFRAHSCLMRQIGYPGAGVFLLRRQGFA
jgi:hypothetical protein